MASSWWSSSDLHNDSGSMDGRGNLPPTRVSSFAGLRGDSDHIGSTDTIAPSGNIRGGPPPDGGGSPPPSAHLIEASSYASPLKDTRAVSVDGSPCSFTRDDEFRISALRRVLSCHSGNPLDADEARSLSDELAALEERQQAFLRASLERMQLDARSSRNTSVGRAASSARQSGGGGGGGWGGVGAFVASAVRSAGATFGGVRRAAANAASVGSGGGSDSGSGVNHHSGKIKADDDTDGSRRRGDATPSNDVPAALHHGGGRASSDDGAESSTGTTPASAAAARHQGGSSNHHHSRTVSSGVAGSMLVRRAVATGASRGSAGMGDPTASSGGWTMTSTPPTHAAEGPDIDADDGFRMAANGTAGVLAGATGGGGTAVAIPVSGSAATALPVLRRDAPALGAGAPRAVVLGFCSLLLALVAFAPADVFVVATSRGGAGTAAALHHHHQPDQQHQHGGDDHGGHHVSPHRAWHLSAHVFAAAMALGSAGFVLRPAAGSTAATVATRRLRAGYLLQAVRLSTFLACCLLMADVARAAAQLERLQPSHGLLLNVWAGIDACVGSSFALAWLTSIDAGIIIVCDSMLRALASLQPGAAASNPTVADTSPAAVTPRSTAP